MKNLIKVVLSTLVVSLLVLASPHFVSAQNSTATSDIAELQQQISDLKQQVTNLQKRLDESTQDDDSSTGSSDENDDEDEERDETEEDKEDEDAEEDDEGNDDEDKSEEKADDSAEAGPSQRALSMMPDFVLEKLQYGQRNELVRKLQEVLAESPEIYPQGLTTGYYGDLTKQAVARLQHRLGMSADGSKVDSRTFTRLQSLLNDGAGNSGVIPPGLLQSAPVQRWLSAGTSSTATSTATTSQPRPNIDQLPIDDQLKEQLRGILNSAGGNPSAGGPPADRGPSGSPPNR